MSDDTLALLTRLTDYAQQSESAIAKVTLDVERLREDRYRPYLASMSAFLLLFMAAVGYIYAMEQRLTDGFFQIQASLHELRAYERINQDRIEVLDRRLSVRTETMTTRWRTHTAQHEQIDQGRQMMAQEILTIGRELREDAQ